MRQADPGGVGAWEIALFAVLGVLSLGLGWWLFERERRTRRRAEGRAGGPRPYPVGRWEE